MFLLCPSIVSWSQFSSMTQQPNEVQDYRTLDVYNSHTWHTTLGRNPLDGWSVRRRDLYLTTHNNQKRQISMSSRGIRTRNPSKRLAVDLRRRPLGHWYRQVCEHCSLALCRESLSNTKTYSVKLPVNEVSSLWCACSVTVISCSSWKDVMCNREPTAVFSTAIVVTEDWR